MKEFKSASTLGSEKELIKAALGEAGAIEIYQTGTWQNIGNFHTDSVGDYVGENLSVIPDNAEVRWEVMDAKDYAGSILANCGGDADDYVCEETGKVLVVQFYIPQVD